MTLAIAIAGVLLGLASLTWQFFTWRRSGARVTAELAPLTFMGDKSGTVYACVRITNSGRGAIQVTGVYCEPPPVIEVYRMAERPPLHSRFPFLLAGLHTESVAYHGDSLAQAIGAQGYTGEVRAFVELGNGARVPASGSFRIGPAAPLDQDGASGPSAD